MMDEKMVMEELANLKKKVEELTNWRDAYVPYQRKKERLNFISYLVSLVLLVFIGGLVTQGTIEAVKYQTKDATGTKVDRFIIRSGSDKVGIDVKNAYFNLQKTGTADASVNGKDSFIARFIGSGWTGSTAEDEYFGIATKVTNSSNYELAILDKNDAKLVSFKNNGQLDMNSHKIINVADPDPAPGVNPQDAATKAYVDAKTGGTASGSGWSDDGTTVRLTTSTDVVGIGTSTPNANCKLHVVETGTNNKVRIDVTTVEIDANTDHTGTLTVQAANTGQKSAIIKRIAGATVDIFEITDETGATIYLKVDKDGNTTVSSQNATVEIK